MSDPPDRQRLDVWLDVACLFKTRSQAATACKAGKVDVNGDRGTPHRLVRPGDTIRISRTGRKQTVVVLGLAEQHLPKPEARALYDDVTPPPSPEELELRRIARAAGIRSPRPATAPDKRDRRAIRRLKRQGDSE